MSDRVSVERKEFESFLAENQKLVERSQGLMDAIDRLENENMRLRDELEASRARLETFESYMANMRETDESLKRVRGTMSRLVEEAEKRISKYTSSPEE